MSAIRSRGGLRMPGMGAGELCEGPWSFVGEAGACASGRSRTCHCGFSCRLCGFCVLSHVRRVGMSREVNTYSLSSGGSIDPLRGVAPATWGGPRRAQGAVRAAPKIKNCGTTRVNKYETRRIPSGYRPTGGRAQKTLITVNTVTQATVHLSKDTFPQHTVQSHKAAS